MRPVTSLADVLRACEALDGDELRAAVPMLGFRLRDRTAGDSRGPGAPAFGDRRQPTGQGHQARPNVETELEEPDDGPVIGELDPVAPTVGPSGGLGGLLPAPVDEVEPAHHRWRPGLQPLLDPRLQAGIITALCHRLLPGSDIDIDAVIDGIARRTPIDQVPMRRRPVTSRGVEVLVDAAEGLDPFRRDVEHLLDTVIAIIGGPRVRLHHFEHTPLASGVWQPRSVRPEPFGPEPGATVLVVTDFGLAGRPLESESVARSWLQIVRGLEAQDSTVTFLVPSPADRWAGSLRSLTLVTWDRSTTRVEVMNSRKAGGPGAGR